MQDIVARLQGLLETQKAMDSAGPLGRLTTLATHYDPAVANRAIQSFQPAVPASGEAFVLGAIGFVVGGGLVHLIARPFRRRRAVARGLA